MPVQEWIYRMETVGGRASLRLVLALLGFVALALLYDRLEFQNFSSPEAMDTAQLARNVARGKGYSTQFIRPLSVYLVEVNAVKSGEVTNDFGRLQQAHPDLANPPVFPTLLAAWMKVLPFNASIPEGKVFRRYAPDLMIAVFNQGLLLGVVVLVFFLGRNLFDSGVGWLAALLVAFSAPFWRYATAGLPSIALQLVFLLLVICLVAFERMASAESPRLIPLASLAAGAGVLVGIGALTRYAFGALIIGVALFTLLYAPRRKATLTLIVLVSFAVVLTPWLARNHALGGTWFGTASFAVFETTTAFPGDLLPRAFVPSLEDVTVTDLVRKWMTNLGHILRTDLPTLGGNWIGGFFMVGLLLPFSDPGRARIRNFLMISLGIFVIAQALGQTQLSEAQHGPSSENLLLILSPLVFLFGAAMLLSLIEQLPLQEPHLKGPLLVLAVGVLSLPMLLTLLPPTKDPRVFPPYFPPSTQQFCGWMQPDELIMSDQPWAIAWYGDRPSIWIPWHLRDEEGLEDFYAVHRSRQPVAALHLSRRTLDQPYFPTFRQAEVGSWGHFALESFQNQKLPAGFPLRHTPAEFIVTGDLFITDRARWQIESPTPATGETLAAPQDRDSPTPPD